MSETSSFSTHDPLGARREASPALEGVPWGRADAGGKLSGLPGDAFGILGGKERVPQILPNVHGQKQFRPQPI
jgi:hypothetical protein